jgi:hypothetical protein
MSDRPVFGLVPVFNFTLCVVQNGIECVDRVFLDHRESVIVMMMMIWHRATSSIFKSVCVV